MSTLTQTLALPARAHAHDHERSIHLTQRTEECTVDETHEESQQTREITSEPDYITSRSQTAAIISSISGITGLSSCVLGILVVAIPSIARDIHLSTTLLLWPSSIYSLVCGCTLLLCGSIADAIGSRLIFLLGSFLHCLFTLACGLSRTGTQLIVFRGLCGLAISFCLTSATSIITRSFAPGRGRNVAFACMGGGQPFGFAVGVTLGGVFADTIGWRWAFYLSSIANAILFAIAAWALPKTASDSAPIKWSNIRSEIDWIGALVASSSLAMLSYVFASLTSSLSTIRSPVTIALLCCSLALIPVFIFWMSHQTRHNRPSLIPNALWKNTSFTSMTLCVFLTWGSFSASAQFISFFFQYLQHLTPLQSSLRLLPDPIAGAIYNIVIALIVHRFRADYIVIVFATGALIPPILMAVASPAAPYWAFAFPSITLNACSADAMFTVANLLITSVFPAKTQGLAGGVFNTAAQIGKSVGLALTAVIANAIADRVAYHAADGHGEKSRADSAVLEGYKAAFWFCFACGVAALIVAMWGLRSVGKVGLKRE